MSWEERRIEHLADEVRDTVDPGAFGDAEVDHYSIPALDATGKPETQPASQIQSHKQWLRGGEILLSRLNPRKARVLRVPPLTDRVALASSEFVVLRPHSVAPRFLEYVLLSEGTRQTLDGAVQSVTRSHQRIRPEQLLKLRVAVPIERRRQQAIADFLDNETARIDALITKKRRMIDVLAEAEGRRVSQMLGCEVAFLDALACPTATNVVPLRRVAAIRGGLTLGKRYREPTVEMPYLRVANVQDGFLDLDDIAFVTVPVRDSSRFALRIGDVLVLEGNGNPANLGRGAVWWGQIDLCLHQNHVHAVRPNQGVLLPEYLALVLRTEWARHFFTSGSAQVSIATLSQSRLGDLPLPLPPVNEQKALVDWAGRLSATMSGTAAALRRQLGLVREHRRGLITAAVTGELEVPEVAA